MKAIASLLACLCWSWMLGLAGLEAQPTDDQRRLAEFGRLSQQIMDTTDPDQQIALVEQAQTLLASIRNWPANLPSRELIDPDMRALLGQAYLIRNAGDPSDNLEKAIAHLEASVHPVRAAPASQLPGPSARWGSHAAYLPGRAACARTTWRRPSARRKRPSPYSHRKPIRTNGPSRRPRWQKP